MALRPLFPEDEVVCYRVFPTNVTSREELPVVLEAYLEWLYTTFPFLSSFIWQVDAFELAIIDPAHDADMPLGFQGETCFGDNIADEW